MKQRSSLPVNWFGIASVLCTVAFWIYVDSPHPRYSVYLDVAFVGILSCSVPASLIAAWRGSKLWLITLLGPLSGWMLIWSFRND
jgi:hypothetical protein